MRLGTMDQSAYVTGFFGVLVGITLTELIKGLADTLRHRKRISYYVPHGILTFTLFIIIVQSLFDFLWLTREITNWTPVLIVRFAVPWIVICLSSYLVFPSFQGDQIIDFKAYFNSFFKGVLQFAMVMIPVIVAFHIFSLKYDFLHVENLVMIGFFTLIIFTLMDKSNRLTTLPLYLGIGYLLYKTIWQHG